MNNILIEFAYECIKYRTEIYTLLFSLSLISSLLLLGADNE